MPTAVDSDWAAPDKRVIIGVITRVVRGDDISQLLLRDGLLLRGVPLLDLIHRGDHTVETLGHAGPHPVLKEWKTLRQRTRRLFFPPRLRRKNLRRARKGASRLQPAALRRSTRNGCLDILRLHSKCLDCFHFSPTSSFPLLLCAIC